MTLDITLTRRQRRWQYPLDDRDLSHGELPFIPRYAGCGMEPPQRQINKSLLIGQMLHVDPMQVS